VRAFLGDESDLAVIITVIQNDELVFQLQVLCGLLVPDQIVIVVQILVFQGLIESLLALSFEVHGCEGVEVDQCVAVAPYEFVSLEDQYR
jgi:hypothetical protein